MTEPTRRRSVFRITWIRMLLFVFVLVFGGIFGWWYVQSAALNAELNAIRIQGLPTNGEQLSDFYRVPDNALDTTQHWIQAIDAAATATNSNDVSGLPIVGNGPTPIPKPDHEWAQLAECREWLTSHDDVMQSVRKACNAGGVARFPVDFELGIQTLLPHTQDSRNAARLLVLDAYVSLHDGDSQQALDDLHGMLAASNALQAEPTLMSQLVRMALFAIACETISDLLPAGNWNDVKLMMLQEKVRTADFKQSIRVGLIGERAICLQEIRKTAPAFLYQPNAEMALELFSRALESLSDDWATAIAIQAEISSSIRSRMAGAISRMRYFAALTLLPAQEQAVIAGARSAAKQRCLICAIAAERHRGIHGEYPASLSEIDIELFAPTIQNTSDTVDPFTGTALKYVVNSQGIVVYSVGPDLTDEGGSIDGDDGGEQTDVGVQLLRPTAVP